MKYLRTYEENIENAPPSKYAINDYVLIEEPPHPYGGSDSINDVWKINKTGKIIGMSLTGQLTNNLKWLYRFKTIRFDKPEISRPWITKEYIVRELTEKEIEDFETELKTIKYNL